MPDAPIQLDYAQGDEARRRRRIRRVIITAMVLSIVFAGWRFGPVAYNYVRDAYYLRQCMNYGAPADRVVYEEDPLEFNALLANPGYHKGWHAPGFHDNVHFVAPILMRWKKWLTIQPTIFLHARQAPGKAPQLVEVFVPYGGAHSTKDSSSPDWQVRIALQAFVKTPGGDVETMDYPPALRHYSSEGDLPAGDPLYVRLYAGQPDPNDPAHFTIPYSIGSKQGVLDCYLNANDKVEFKPRDVQ